MQKLTIKALCVLALLIAVGTTAQADETKRKRYTFDFNPKTRRASSLGAQSKARQAFLRDYLSEKFSPEIVNAYAEDIDIALDPPDEFLKSFEIVSERPNADETQVTITVEGVVDIASMVARLVENKVLSFGDDPPKIMVLPSSRFENPGAAKAIRALIGDKVKQSGLRSVAFEGITETLSIQVTRGGQLSQADRKILIRKALEYGADYLVYIDTQADVRPFSQGGYIADSNFTYTILRPNANMILGEQVISGRGNGASAMLAFDRSLDEVQDLLGDSTIGDLYSAIFSDSDVITNVEQIKSQIELVVHEATPAQMNAIMDRLRQNGARVDLGVGSGVVNRLRVEVAMEDEALYNWFNAQSFSVAGKTIKTPVVAFAENVIEVEAIPVGGTAKRALAGKPKPRPRPTGGQTAKSGGGGGFGGGGSKAGGGGNVLAAKAKVTLKLRPAKFSGG